MLEILLPILNNIPSAIALAVGAGAIRNLGGFVENILADGKVDAYELKQLGGTVVRYFVYILLLSMSVDIHTATAIAFGMDYFKGLTKSV